MSYSKAEQDWAEEEQARRDQAEVDWYAKPLTADGQANLELAGAMHGFIMEKMMEFEIIQRHVGGAGGGYDIEHAASDDDLIVRSRETGQRFMILIDVTASPIPEDE